MKILFSVFRYHTNMVSLVKSLTDSGHSVLLLVVAQEPYEDRDSGSVKLISSEGDIGYQISNIVNDFNPDIGIVRYALNEKVAPIVSKCLKKTKTRCVSYEQNPCYASNFATAIYYGLRHSLYQIRRGLPLFEISPKMGNKNGYPVPFRRYFRFPIQVDLSVRGGDLPGAVINIVAVGKLGVERKRLHWVVNALQASNVDYELTLVGANDISRYPNRSLDYYNYLYDHTIDGRAQGRIKILENVPFKGMKFIYEKADVFVLPSKGEKFGISPLEAAAHGCAVLCPHDNGSSNYFTHGYNALIFDSVNYDDFEYKLNQLVRDREKIKKMGSAGLETVRVNHSLISFESFLSAIVTSKGSFHVFKKFFKKNNL
jgi:glycosyltransferase involved in cell wall biosynthesis